MAFIIKSPKELGVYQRIDFNNCFINSNGLYLATIVYKSKSERDKEKSRLAELSSFARKSSEEISFISSMPDGPEKEKSTGLANDLSYVLSQIENMFYRYDYSEEFKKANPDFSEPERVSLTPSQIVSAEAFGFKKEWLNDPVLLVRRDTVLSDSARNHNFELAHFYETYKQNILRYPGGEIVFEDDI
jgi:hypothetical protein